MSAPGDTGCLHFYAAAATTGIEYELTAQGQNSFPVPMYVWGVSGPVGADCQYLLVKCEGASWEGQGISVAPKNVAAVGEEIIRFPVQRLLPANEVIELWALQDSGGNQAARGTLWLSKSPVPGIPVGNIFSETFTQTAGNGTFAAGTARKVPSLPGRPPVQLLGGATIGAGAITIAGGIRTTSIPTDTYSETGPTWPGAYDVQVQAPTFHAIPEAVTLQAGDTITPVAKDASAGTVRHHVYWRTG